MSLAPDYPERVYAGVLGKIIGVYLGRPFEGWTYERIIGELGEITYYVHERLGMPLVVTDDDISGTFTFLRALPDYDNSPDLTPAQIGQTWLNYIIEGRTILWWGGLGNSTEHTAYLRLKRGIPSPHSGAIATNGKVVAEQIGAQIFVDGWAMVTPGDPELATDLARRAASVSHDGEAIYGAQMLAAMEAQAFVDRDVDALLDMGLRFIPSDSVIARLVHDIRDWHTRYDDWRRARERIAGAYGYDRYGGNCHVVPTHALIILGLLYGESNFQRSLNKDGARFHFELPGGVQGFQVEDSIESRGTATLRNVLFPRLNQPRPLRPRRAPADPGRQSGCGLGGRYASGGPGALRRAHGLHRPIMVG